MKDEMNEKNREKFIKFSNILVDFVDLIHAYGNEKEKKDFQKQEIKVLLREMLHLSKIIGGKIYERTFQMIEKTVIFFDETSQEKKEEIEKFALFCKNELWEL